jgi:hypothetical protein
MVTDTQLVLLVTGLHVIALACGGVLVYLCLRGETTRAWKPPEDGSDDGDGGSRLRPPTPSGPRGGGIPLPDAQPARVRLREPARLAEKLPRRERRPAREPAPGPRVPT